MTEEFERTLDFILGTLELTAEEIRPIEEGYVVRAPSTPGVWALNHVRVTRPISYERALEITDEHQADLPYRQLQIVHEATGRALEQTFRREGWKFEREVVMVLARDPDHELDTSAVVDADEESMLALMRRWYGEDPPETTPDGLRQLIEYSRREGRARGDRNLGVQGASNGLVAITKLRSDGRIAQVEDVYTAPEARCRGYGRALVTRAAMEAQAAGHELIFIVADDADWPKHLYRQIGFEPAGFTWSFHRDV